MNKRIAVKFMPRDTKLYSFLSFSRNDLTVTSLQDGIAAKFETKLVGQFDDHSAQVWRVSWNILGTILASSGDDGCVRLWKGDIRTFSGAVHFKGIALSSTVGNRTLSVVSLSSHFDSWHWTVTPHVELGYSVNDCDDSWIQQQMLLKGIHIILLANRPPLAFLMSRPLEQTVFNMAVCALQQVVCDADRCRFLPEIFSVARLSVSMSRSSTNTCLCMHQFLCNCVRLRRSYRCKNGQCVHLFKRLAILKALCFCFCFCSCVWYQTLSEIANLWQQGLLFAVVSMTWHGAAILLLKWSCCWDVRAWSSDLPPLRCFVGRHLLLYQLNLEFIIRVAYLH